MKTGHPGENVDAVAGKLRADHIDFGFDDVEGAEGEICHGDLFLHAIVDAVDALILIARKMEDGFADGFAGDGAGVDGGATDDFEFLDKTGALAELGRLNGGALAARSGPHHDEIVLFHGLPREYITVGIVESLLTSAWRSAIMLKIRFAALRP